MATIRRISASRSVSCGASAPPGGGPAASRRNSPSTSPARPGVNTASPAAVRRTASRNSARAADFSRYPAAPALTASSTSCCSPLADRMSTRAAGRAAGRPRVTSTPEASGSRRSSTTTSGRAAPTTRSACAPSLAVATTSYPASVRSRATASRHIGWSSTIMTRTRGSARRQPRPHPRLIPGPRGWARPHRRGRRSSTSVPGARARTDVRRAAQVADPAADGLADPEPPVRRRLGQPPRRDARAVVPDRHRDLSPARPRPAPTPSRPGRPQCRRTLSSAARTAERGLPRRRAAQPDRLGRQ